MWCPRAAALMVLDRRAVMLRTAVAEEVIRVAGRRMPGRHTLAGLRMPAVAALIPARLRTRAEAVRMRVRRRMREAVGHIPHLRRVRRTTSEKNFAS